MDDLRNKHNIDLVRCKGAYLENAPSEIWDNPDWCLEPKIDGYRVSLQIGKKRSYLVGRNRQDFLKGVDRAKEFRHLDEYNPWLPTIYYPALDGTILDGELTETFKMDGTLDEDTQVRLKTGLFVGFTVWQILFFRGEDVRNWPDEHRRVEAGRVVGELNHPKIRLIKRVRCLKPNLDGFFHFGYEGAVAKNIKMPIPPQRTNPHWYKIKGDQHRTVDAFIVGSTEAKEGGSMIQEVSAVPNGKAATFTMAMMKDGQVVQVGKMANLPAEAVEFGFSNFEMFAGKVVEMLVSGWDGKRFRSPRFLKWREDKTPSCCVWGEQIGRSEDG